MPEEKNLKKSASKKEEPKKTQKEEPKKTSQKEDVKKSLDVEKKIKAIEASKMPEKQKREYIESLKAKKDDKEARVTFAVYAKIKKITNDGLRSAMLAYPRAKGVVKATVQEWDEIFKGF